MYSAKKIKTYLVSYFIYSRAATVLKLIVNETENPYSVAYLRKSSRNDLINLNFLLFFLADCSISSDDDENDAKSGLERFLAAWGLSEYLDRFLNEKIDLDALMLLTEEDLRQLSLPLGHHRKLATAIAERRSVLQGPPPPCITDSRL